MVVDAIIQNAYSHSREESDMVKKKRDFSSCKNVAQTNCEILIRRSS